LATSGPLGDLDVIYFDRTNSWTTAQATLQAVLPEYRWEVTNQATVHQWQSSATGREILGYESIAAAVAGWPETATAVGVRLTPRGAMKFVAPFGLADLFTMTVRRGPMAPDPSAFDLRLRDKAWHLRWPQLTVVRGAG